MLEQAKGIINGITCGAGMPYRLSDIAARFNVYYYPIVSSARAFNALWKRAYSKAASLLGGVVARIGSTIYDGSVRGRLQSLERRLSAET